MFSISKKLLFKKKSHIVALYNKKTYTMGLKTSEITSIFDIDDKTKGYKYPFGNELSKIASPGTAKLLQRLFHKEGWAEKYSNENTYIQAAFFYLSLFTLRFLRASDTESESTTTKAYIQVLRNKLYLTEDNDTLNVFSRILSDIHFAADIRYIELSGFASFKIYFKNGDTEEYNGWEKIENSGVAEIFRIKSNVLLELNLFLRK